MYGQVSPEQMHSVLVKYNSSYIILEDSICLWTDSRCSTPSIIDLSYGHVIYYLICLL